MARKKVIINDNELTPTVLYTKKKRRGGLIWLVLMFAAFIYVVLNLPDIVNYINAYLNPTAIIIDNDSDDDNSDEEDNEDVDVIEYTLSDTLKIEMEKFDLTNFKVENNILTFDIISKTNTMLDFSSLHYFLNLYNNNKMLLQRIMIDDVIISPSETKTVSYLLDDANVSVLSFLEILVDDYPSHVITPNQDGNATLICEKDNETVKYLLKDNKVYSIEDEFVVSANDPDYSTYYSSFQALATTYNSINGINSSVSVANNILTFKTIINLDVVGNDMFNNKIYYSKDTDAKVMNFELESNGYKCN